MLTSFRQPLLNAAPALLLFFLLLAHVTALRSISLVIAAVTAIYVWRKEGCPPIPLKLPLLVWAGMALASLAWAKDRSYSFSEIRVEIGYCVGYFLVFFVLTRNRQCWNLFRAALLAGLAVMTAVAVRLYTLNHDLHADSYLGGVLTTSTLLVTVFPILLAATYEFRREVALLALNSIAIAAALAVGYLTFIRNFILSIDAIVLTVAAMLVGRHASSKRRLAVFALVGILAVGGSLAFLLSVAKHRSGTQSIDATVQTTIDRDPRWSIWEFSLDLIRERPLTGVGFGRFAAVDLYRKNFPDEIFYSHAHNPFLNYAVQMGVGGVAALSFLLFALLREFWRLWKSGLPQVAYIGLTGIAMLVGVLVKTQTDDLWTRQQGYLFWALTGMMLGYAHRLQSAAPTPTNPTADKSHTATTGRARSRG
ncbi:MAG TPA: O-antigen ligase family protein [Burkholderiales bacterium]|nr:O-antigen ligase family protein [Burkholderiales bacterium]